MINSVSKSSFGTGAYAPTTQAPDREYPYYVSAMQQPQKDSFLQQKPRDGRSFWDKALAPAIVLSSALMIIMSIRNGAKTRKAQQELIERMSRGNAKDLPNRESGLIQKFVAIPSSPKNFNDAIGMNEEKKILKRLILDPLQSSETKKIYIDEYGLNMPSGILLEGAPGNGKTFLMEALAGELKTDLYKLNMSELGSKYIHETGENIAKMMAEIKEKAKKSEKPIILFLDELDGLAVARTSDAKSHELEELNTILQNINNLQDHNIILVGATNRKDLIDNAILRPGRFAEHIYVHNPDENAREALLRRFMENRPKAKAFLANPEQVSDVVKKLDGLSNAEIKYIVDNSARLGFEDKMSAVSMNHIEKAVSDFKASREKH